MRRLPKRIRAMAQRHVALTLGLAAVTVGIAGVLSLAAITGAFNATPPVAGTYTFSADWTLLDLERHIEAGEVATISLVTAPSGVPVAPAGTASSAAADILAARTTSGQWVRFPSLSPRATLWSR